MIDQDQNGSRTGTDLYQQKGDKASMEDVEAMEKVHCPSRYALSNKSTLRFLIDYNRLPKLCHESLKTCLGLVVIFIANLEKTSSDLPLLPWSPKSKKNPKLPGQSRLNWRLLFDLINLFNVPKYGMLQ
jgi:hypothetical protein